MKYIVQPWETWESVNNIASRFGITADQLIAANPILNTMTIQPGMVLTIPGGQPVTLPATGYIEYVVQSGDSIYRIANRFRLNYRNIIAQNPQIPNPDVLWPGQILYLIYR